MWPELIDKLNTEDRHALEAFGVFRSTLSDWRNSRRLPTEVQVIALAEVAGVDRHALQDEVALLRATPAQRSVLERLMKKAGGVAAALAIGVALAVVFGSMGAGGAGRLFARR